MKHITLFLTLAFASPLHAETAPVLGRIGDIEITTPELRENLAGLEASVEKPLVADPAALNQYARALLLQRLILKQALDAKWDQQPSVISRLVRARETAITESYLSDKSTPAVDYPSASDLNEAYEANKDKLLIPRSYLLAQIYISAPEGMDEKADAAAKTRLDTVVKQLAVKGADFGAIARKSSEESTSAADGGKIGWLAETQIQPEIREKLPKLTVDAVSEPVRLKDGWHILKVLDVKEGRTPSLSEVRDELSIRLREERARSMRQEIIAGLLKEYPLAINEIELSKLISKP